VDQPNYCTEEPAHSDSAANCCPSFAADDSKEELAIARSSANVSQHFAIDSTYFEEE
jgi:hypothetical protein